MLLLNLLSYIGYNIICILENIGKITIFVYNIIATIFTRSVSFNMILRQIMNIGYFSIPVVTLTSFFSGAVLALQSYNGFSRFYAENSIATVVVLSITRELGPVLGSLMVAARAGSSIAAEIGTMRVTEQIDALKSLSTDPIKYLILPRVIAGFISLPILVLLGDVIGVFGGYIVSVTKLGFNGNIYIENTFKYLQLNDIYAGIYKAASFSLLITIVSCYHGYYASKGAKGVGEATNKAVVHSCISILIMNYIVTQVFLV